MKKSFLKALILLNLSLFLTSCNINFEINLSGNSSSTSLNESTKIGTVKVKEAIIPVSNEAFEFDNASCNISSTGFVIQEGSSSYILGGGSNPGSLEFEFPENISLNRIEILGYAYENDSFSCNVSINDEEKEVTYYKTNTTFLDFENSEIVKSFSIKSNGVGSRIKFYGIKLYYNDIVPVTGINIVKDLEVEVNKKISVSSYYEVLPSNATNKKVELSCSSDFVSIESEFIKCLKEGEYDISIKTVDGDFKATLHVTATSSTLQEGIRKLTREEIAFDYDEIFSPSHYEGLIPSRGNPNIIVVPVNFSDLKSVYDFNANDNLNRLNAAFNGSNYDHTNSYSHSLRSFYKASSYGALDMEFIISDVFTPSFTSSSFINKESRVDGGGTYKLLEEIYNSATIDGKKINFNDTKYDLNKDGFVDGIWLIYNDDRELTSSSYWPYTYWYYNIDDEGYILSGGPNISCYANCSVYFTYEDSSTGEDYHTLVHETGHMLGLDDYYITTSTSTMSAIGGLDMMDYNIGDHNAFSKFALNWIEPYIVESPTSITLSPFQDNGDALIIPSSYFNDSAFSEYLIIEYYTPTKLNELDSKNRYSGRNYYFTESGIRIFHVDARLMGLSYSSSTGEYEFTGKYLDESYTTIPNDADYYQVVGSNTPSYAYNNYHLIEAVTCDNRLTYKGSETNNSSLFQVGDVFSPTNQSKFFKNSSFHDGSKVNYKIEVISMDENGCTLNISNF